MSYLTVVECKNTIENPDKCASPEEIEKFLRISQIILTVAETKVVEGIYEDDATFFSNGQYYPVKNNIK